MFMRAILLLALISSVHLRFLDNTLLWKREISGECVPFTVYKVDCNTCVCGADGRGACTKKGCLKFKRSNADYYEEN